MRPMPRLILSGQLRGRATIRGAEEMGWSVGATLVGDLDATVVEARPTTPTSEWLASELPTPTRCSSRLRCLEQAARTRALARFSRSLGVGSDGSGWSSR